MQKRLTSTLVVFGCALFAVTLLLNVGRLGAAPAQSSPSLISYQGYLLDSSGNPIDGVVALEIKIYDASTGGDLKWQEVQTNVQVDAGYFTVMLGAVTPLTGAVFSGTPRYLQVGVNTDNNGAGPFETLPRQQMASVPYAHWSTRSVTATQAMTASYAVEAGTAMSAASAATVPWSGLTGVPAGFADGSDDGSNYKYVVVVAKEGGHYTSVAQALNSITPTASSPYLVWVAPGVYTETALVEVKGYVHLKGAGPRATKITSTRTGATQNSDAATARLYDQGRISNLDLYNSGGNGAYAIALWMADDVTHATVVDNVRAVVDGSGGVGHYAVYLSDAQPKITRSWLHARGAVGFGTAVNAAVGSVNSSGGGFPQALIEHSVLLGAEQNNIACNDNTGTGFGLELIESSPIVRDSYICGGHRAVYLGINGSPQIHGSLVKVSSTNGAYLVETTAGGIASFGTSQLSYVSDAQTGLSTGAGSAPRCAQSYDGAFADLDASCQ